MIQGEGIFVNFTRKSRFFWVFRNNLWLFFSFKESLAIRKMVLETDHEDIAETLNYIALNNRKLNKYEKAIQKMKPMRSNGNQRKSMKMKNSEQQWKSLKYSENQWESMKINRYLWKSMKISES